ADLHVERCRIVRDAEFSSLARLPTVLRLALHEIGDAGRGLPHFVRDCARHPNGGGHRERKNEIEHDPSRNLDGLTDALVGRANWPADNSVRPWHRRPSSPPTCWQSTSKTRRTR